MHRWAAFPGFISPKSISSIEKKTFEPIVETNDLCLGISSFCPVDLMLDLLEYPVPSIKKRYFLINLHKIINYDFQFVVVSFRFQRFEKAIQIRFFTRKKSIRVLFNIKNIELWIYRIIILVLFKNLNFIWDLAWSNIQHFDWEFHWN